MERQSRLVYSEEQKEVLTTFFNEGMTSTKKAMCDKIRACATRVGISEDQVKSREIAKLTADLKELKPSNDELRQKLASNTSRFTADDQQPDQLLLPAGQATVEMGWGYLRKQLREFTLNTQIPRRNCSFANIVRKYYSRCAFKTLELCSNILQSHNQKAVVNMLDALRVICIVLWSIFRPSDQGLSWVFFPTLHDWLRKFAPLSRPIRSKKKSN